MVSSITMNINIPTGKFLKIVHRLDDALWYAGSKKIPQINGNFQKTRKNDDIESNLINTVNNQFANSQYENENLYQIQRDNLNLQMNNKDLAINTIEKDVLNMIQAININSESSSQEQMKNLIESFQIDLTNNMQVNMNQSVDVSDSYIHNGINNSNTEDNITICNNNIKLKQTDLRENPTQTVITEQSEIQDENSSKITTEKMDENINIIFITLLKLHFFYLRDSGIFPMDPGKLYKEYMKPLSQEINLPLDFKLSSYKKINNYLKSLDDKNILNFGKPKGMQNDFIISILWEHPFIKDFTLPIKKIEFLEKKDSQTESSCDKENVILQKDEKIEILQKYRPNQKIKIFFPLIDIQFDDKSYYPLKYCNEILIKYLKEKNLLLKDSNVKLNQELEDALFRTKQNVFRPDEIIVKMDEILQRWKENLTEKSFITKTNSTNESEIVTNNQFKVKIFAKKLHNKNVTIVEGLQNFVNVKDVIKTFSKHFACSVTLKDFQEFKDAIFIQGYWVNELQNILQGEIKLNKKFIQVEDKLKIKKK